MMPYIIAFAAGAICVGTPYAMAYHNLHRQQSAERFDVTIHKILVGQYDEIARNLNAARDDLRRINDMIRDAA